MSMDWNRKQGRTHSMRPVRQDRLLQLDSLRVGRVRCLAQPVLLRRRLIGVQVLVECVCLHIRPVNLLQSFRRCMHVLA